MEIGHEDNKIRGIFITHFTVLQAGETEAQGHSFVRQQHAGPAILPLTRFMPALRAEYRQS